MIKFSVLIPTRNRLEYLQQSIISVLEQDYNNWEIIVSDNCSEQDVRSYVSSLNDSRIKYFRTDSFVPVTENWNNALSKSSGDYVVMLGDDDCLLKDYFSICTALVNRYQFPDWIYTSAFLYIYPNAIIGNSKGDLKTWENASFLSKKQRPFFLDKNERIRLARKTMNFNVMINFNMQFSLVSRSLISSLLKYGPFYQSPYPDYYATTAMLLKAERILAVCCPITVIGITPKSFGSYYFNQKEEAGIEMLKNAPEDSVLQKVKSNLLPGSNMNTSWLLALETVKRNFGNEIPLCVNYRKYRFLQMIQNFYKIVNSEKTSFNYLLDLCKRLKFLEKILYFFPLVFFQLCPRRITIKIINRILYLFSHPSHGIPKKIEGNFETILDVFHKINVKKLPEYEKFLLSEITSFNSKLPQKKNKFSSKGNINNR